jgi:hypothetical protein
MKLYLVPKIIFIRVCHESSVIISSGSGGSGVEGCVEKADKSISLGRYSLDYRHEVRKLNNRTKAIFLYKIIRNKE